MNKSSCMDNHIYITLLSNGAMDYVFVLIIICLIRILENASVIAIEMDEDSIRLSGGQNAHEGHVDVLLNGHWFSVCGTNWDLLEAIVACRQLGYHTAEAALRGSPFNNTGGPNWMVVGWCTGFEASLTQCSQNYGIESCRNYHAGVVCSSELAKKSICL